jgi:hypothetical protein
VSRQNKTAGELPGAGGGGQCVLLWGMGQTQRWPNKARTKQQRIEAAAVNSATHRQYEAEIYNDLKIMIRFDKFVDLHRLDSMHRQNRQWPTV